MLSMQRQARPPARFSRLSHTALASAAALVGGKIDNQSLNGLVSYALSGHKFSAGYQHMSGDSAFPYVNYSARDADEVRLLVSYSVALW